MFFRPDESTGSNVKRIKTGFQIEFYYKVCNHVSYVIFTFFTFKLWDKFSYSFLKTNWFLSQNRFCLQTMHFHSMIKHSFFFATNDKIVNDITWYSSRDFLYAVTNEKARSFNLIVTLYYKFEEFVKLKWPLHNLSSVKLITSRQNGGKYW